MLISLEKNRYKFHIETTHLYKISMWMSF